MVLGQDAERAGIFASNNGTVGGMNEARLIGRLIRKRDGRVVPFDRSRIAHAVEMAVRAELGCPFPDPIASAAAKQVDAVVDAVLAVLPNVGEGEVIATVEEVQDEVERALMAAGAFAVARRYIIYREARTRRREEAALRLVDADGTEVLLNLALLRSWIAEACAGYEDRVSAKAIAEEVLGGLHSGAALADLERSIVLAARTRIELDPAYSFVAARGLLRGLYAEALGRRVGIDEAHAAYAHAFPDYVKRGVELELLTPELLGYDLERLGAALKPERDFQFQYLGLQTLYDRYLIHSQGRRLELPQMLWMRVAMGLALQEENREERAIQFYNLISSFRFCPSTPTLFNAGTRYPQLSSCYLTTVGDDLGEIFKTVRDNALLSKWSGGIGNDWTPVRALGSHIKGTNGQSQGVIPFLKVANDTAIAVNQCFAPETLVHTANGPTAIRDVKVGDLVLGISGTYREVTDKFIYNQTDPMVEITVKHAIEPIQVTNGHPFYVIRGVPMEQAVSRTMGQLHGGRRKAEWVDAGELSAGDYIAQVIPTEVVPVSGLTADDARLYGILLGDGHLSKDGLQWGVSGNPANDAHLAFVRAYLDARGIHYWQTIRGGAYAQIHWASGRGVLRDGTTGRITGAGAPTLPFSHDDLYDEQGRKRISRRLSHLPRPQALALVHGLLETDGGVSRGTEIYFSNISRTLVEGLRYQLLRLGVPTAGQFRERDTTHTAIRADGAEISFNGMTTCYDVRIPAIPEVAELVGCQPLTKRNWLTWNGAVYSRIRSVASIPVRPFVCDLEVEGDESYMTTSGLAHNGGKRKGAVCAYLEAWHLDVEEFLDLRKNTGDDRRRTHDMNTALWVPDLLLQRVEADGDWTLFSPSDVPDLHDLYGAAFATRYTAYEAAVARGELKNVRTLRAVDLWRAMLTALFETGHPWITFKDAANVRSPQDHAGVVHNSNLCTEILLNTSKDEVAVCNLGSVNLVAHVTAEGIAHEKLRETVSTAMRMLDNVIDLNHYPIPEAKNSNLRHRPVGLGIMGFQDALWEQGIGYASEAAVDFADRSMEAISYYAILASTALAKERGAYPSYPGSKWDRGLLPIDTVSLLSQERGETVEVDLGNTLDWQPVREAIRTHGMRNSNTMAIAPTATIANIQGVAQSIEPLYTNLYVKSNLSGEFTVVNERLVQELGERGLWDAEMLEDLKYEDGSVQNIARIPDEIKERYPTAFEVDATWLIAAAARRQKWIDMGQSLNLYVAEASGRKLHELYTTAWKSGLKTTYYLRSRGATQNEKSTIDVNRRGIQPRWMRARSASSEITVQREAPAASAQPAAEESAPVAVAEPAPNAPAPVAPVAMGGAAALYRPSPAPITPRALPVQFPVARDASDDDSSEEFICEACQ
jgi:ribonucleoside-diphosphate reductase alpha chain